MTIEQKPIKWEVLNKSCATHTSGLSYSCCMHITPISHVLYVYRLCVRIHACMHTHTHTCVCTYVLMYVCIRSIPLIWCILDPSKASKFWGYFYYKTICASKQNNMKRQITIFTIQFGVTKLLNISACTEMYMALYWKCFNQPSK